jgi:hypothetical protein
MMMMMNDSWAGSFVRSLLVVAVHVVDDGSDDVGVVVAAVHVVDDGSDDVGGVVAAASVRALK